LFFILTVHFAQLVLLCYQHKRSTKLLPTSTL